MLASSRKKRSSGRSEVCPDAAYVRRKWPESTGQVHLAIRQAYADGWTARRAVDGKGDVRDMAQQYVERQWPGNAADINHAIREAYIDGWLERGFAPHVN
jgi:hypothetical protein